MIVEELLHDFAFNSNNDCYHFGSRWVGKIREIRRGRRRRRANLFSLIYNIFDTVNLIRIHRATTIPSVCDKLRYVRRDRTFEIIRPIVRVAPYVPIV